MTDDQLRESIANVRQLMQTARDGKEKDLIGDVLANIVNGDNVSSAAGDTTTQLDEQAAVFEADHPKLAGALREVIDSLNKMGL